MYGFYRQDVCLAEGSFQQVWDEMLSHCKRLTVKSAITSGYSIKKIGQ